MGDDGGLVQASEWHASGLSWAILSWGESPTHGLVPGLVCCCWGCGSWAWRSSWGFGSSWAFGTAGPVAAFAAGTVLGGMAGCQRRKAHRLLGKLWLQHNK